ncbi:MAG: MBL fold metallo-hydrolase [Armatimonadota bacterium]|nr:MBL fold metallo-hydrolase [Armatimonadota bacterium]
MALEITRIVVPTPYPVGPVNVYLLPGPPITLVDCGPKTREALAALTAGLTGAGVRLGQVERLVITHGHVDHFGLAARVVAESGARVMVHEGDRPKLLVDRSFLAPMRRFIAEAGFPQEFSDAVVNVLRRYRDQLDRVVATDLLADGDRVDLAGGPLEVLHTPGHAQGHICLRSGDALISGDLLLEEISPNPIVEFGPDGRRLRTLPALLRSLRRIQTLAPAVAYPGHGEALADPAARAAELIQHHAARKEELARMLASRAWTLRELAEAWFSPLQASNIILGLSEVIGHLDLLDDEGRLAVARRDGVLFYRLAGGYG